MSTDERSQTGRDPDKAPAAGNTATNTAPATTSSSRLVGSMLAIVIVVLVVSWGVLVWYRTGFHVQPPVERPATVTPSVRD